MVLKIIKHCQEALPSFVTGQLLGLDIGRTLEVTNCFPFPNKNDDAAAPAGGAEEDGDEDGAEYQMHMMQCLREVNVDNNTVGWYQSTYFSSFIDDSCIDTQFNYQVSVRVRVTRRGEGSGAGQRAEPCSPARAHAHTHARTCRVARAAWHLRAAGPSRGPRAAESSRYSRACGAWCGAPRDALLRARACACDAQENIKNCVVIIYDPSRTRTTGLALRAFRLTDTFMTLYKAAARPDHLPLP